MHTITDSDLRLIIRIQRNWWRLYLVELARLTLLRHRT